MRKPRGGATLTKNTPWDFEIKGVKFDFSSKNLFEKETTVTPAKSDLTCIICGEESNGKHFCRSCYAKYKDKIVYLQVKKCTEFVKLEAEYQSDFTCDDGHMVKSPYEKIIDDWLFKEKINHAYETTLDVDKNHDIHPDFYIPEYNGIRDIYIEFWGYGEENKKYMETKKYKEEIYSTTLFNAANAV